GGRIATGKFHVAADGSVSIGTGTTKFTATKDGDFVWGSSPNSATLDRNGNLFVGAALFADALMKVANNGNFSLVDVATAAHQIWAGAVSPAVGAALAGRAGVPIGTQSPVWRTCLRRCSGTYYRSVARAGLRNPNPWG